MKVCLAQQNRDDEWLHIIYEFAMNYSVDSLRKGYFENQKAEKEKASNELLRNLGYSESDILKVNK